SEGYRVDRQQALMKSTFDIGDTELFYSRGEAEQGVDWGIESYGISQQVPFPTKFINRHKAGERKVELQKSQYNLTRSELIRNVRTAYYRVVFGHQQLELLNELNQIYEDFRRAAQVRYETGETGRLERTAALSRYHNLQAEWQQAQADLEIYYAELQRWSYLGDSLRVAQPSLGALVQKQGTRYVEVGMYQNPLRKFHENNLDVAEAQHALQRSQWLPDFSLEYRKQYVRGMDGFYGFHVGLQVPLWFRGQQKRAQAAAMEVRASRT